MYCFVPDLQQLLAGLVSGQRNSTVSTCSLLGGRL